MRLTGGGSSSSSECPLVPLVRKNGFRKSPNAFADSLHIAPKSNVRRSSLGMKGDLFRILNSNSCCVCYSWKSDLCLFKKKEKSSLPKLKIHSVSWVDCLPGVCEGLTERQIKEGLARRPHAARGSGASLSVCVSARSNSPIPYLEARGSRRRQERSCA